MHQYPSALGAQDPLARPSSLQAESSSTALPRPRRLMPFLTGLGQSFILVPLTVVVVVVFFQLAFWYRNAEECIFVAVPALFIGGLILAIKLTRNPDKQWVGIGFFAGLFLYLGGTLWLLWALYTLLTEL
jgi:hypothetical protein